MYARAWTKTAFFFFFSPTEITHSFVLCYVNTFVSKQLKVSWREGGAGGRQTYGWVLLRRIFR